MFVSVSGTPVPVCTGRVCSRGWHAYPGRYLPGYTLCILSPFYLARLDMQTRDLLLLENF
jgi:hypothetical protein